MALKTSRQEALSLLEAWVSSESLRRHCLAVEAAVGAYAVKGGEDEQLWRVAALLHDADYERFPDMDAADGHPRTIIAELERRGEDPAVIHAIAAHADHLGVPAESALDKTLRACDELSGFLVACAAVRPEGIVGLTPKSVKKKLKTASFAAAVSREDVRGGAEELGLDFDEHVAFVIAALEARADELQLHGTGAGGATS